MIKKINKEKIYEMSKTLTQREIADIMGVSQSYIGKLLRNNGINTSKKRLNMSKLYFDINYFDNIDDHTKAYWLGFIVADGSLKSDKVRLVSKDLEVLERFKKSLKAEHKIVTNSNVDKRTNKKYTWYSVSITNALFTQKLTKYININKSETFKIKNIEDVYYPSFIAGMFDGDGSLSIYKNNKMRITLTSTKECLDQIQEVVFKKIGINKTKLQQTSRGNVWRMFLYKDSMLFLDYIYGENISYLSRKFNKYKDVEC